MVCKKMQILKRKFSTHSKVAAPEAVDDGIDAAVRHGEPVAAEEGAEVDVIVQLALDVAEVLEEPDEKIEELDRQPADDEDGHQRQQHL